MESNLLAFTGRYAALFAGLYTTVAGANGKPAKENGAY